MPPLATLFGQIAPVTSVRRSLTAGTLPGAYLFVGAAGVGKGAMARATAQAAACLSPVGDPADSCGICNSCLRTDAGTQPEIVTFLPAGEQTQIWQFWERDGKPNSGVLSRTINYAPIIGRRRVYIIERAETLTESAANSLLKVLEEPPPYVLFVLAAPHQARVLPTIVSRCQTLRLNPTPRAELESYLTSILGVNSERASLYAALSEGKVGQAVRLVNTPRVSDEIDRIIDLAVTIPDAHPLRALKIAEQIRKLAAQLKALVGEDDGSTSMSDGSEDGEPSTKDKSSRRQLAAVFELMVVFYRDLMALSVGGGDRIMNRGRAEQFSRIAAGSNASRWMSSLDAVVMARRRLDANASVAMVTDALALTLVTQKRYNS